MHRDMDIVRKIVLAVKDATGPVSAASWTFGVLLEYLKMEITRRIPGLE